MEAKLINKVHAAFLAGQQQFEDRPAHPEDFAVERPRTLAALTEILELCHASPRESSLEHALVVPLVCLCGENSSSAPWSSSEHISLSYRILAWLKNRANKSSVSELLQESEYLLAAKCLSWINQRLACQDSPWKRFPGLQESFVWILHQFSFPIPSALIAELLPLSLKLAHDWQFENQLKGVRCVDFLLRNCVPVHLKLFGRKELLEDSMNKLLYSRQVDVVAEVYPLYTAFIALTCDLQPKTPRVTNELDRLTLRLLENMEAESDIPLRRCLGKQLRKILELQLQRGALTRWLSRLFRASESYLVFKDLDRLDESRVTMMGDVLFLLDNVDAEDIQCYVRDLLETQARLLYELSKENPEARNQELFTLCKSALIKVGQMYPNEFRILFHGMEAVQVNALFDETIQTIFQHLPAE